MGLFRLTNPFKKSTTKSSEVDSFVQSILGIKRFERTLYQRALTHSSHNEQDNNERLEFLGDAVLDLIVSDILERDYPDRKEGELTRIRSRLVRRQSLNRLANKIGLNQHIISARKNNSGTSIPGNALEALIGAIYKDQGYQFTYKWVGQHLITRDLIDQAVNEDNDFKSQILIYGQKRKLNVEFESSVTDGGEFKITLNIEGQPLAESVGRSKIEGEQKAAQLALERLTTT